MGWFREEPWVACSSCGTFLPKREWRLHLREAHGANATYPAREEKGSPGVRNKPKSRKGGGRSVGASGTESRMLNRALYEDDMYSGRGLGQMSRENGRFGSLPLYDDYGEDSIP